ncbi:MAG: hypothetical protein ACI4GY_02610, partial [Acutalibacteraceae bacterium]
MKRVFKKTVSLLLTLLLVVCSLSVAAAAQQTVTPVIIISGMTSFPIYNEDGESVFPISNEKIQKDVAKLVLPLAGSALTSNWEIFAKYGMEPIHDLFEETRCDENGNSVYKITPESFPENAGNYKEMFDSDTGERGMIKNVAEKIGWENTYFYHYDWRMNPLDLIDGLDTLVKKAMDESGSSKVSFFAMSFGGMIAESYMAKYGTDHLKNVVFGSTAFNGVELVGRLFAGDPKIEIKDALDYFATFLQNSDFASNVLSVSAAALAKYGVKGEKAVNDYLKAFIDVLKYPLYSEVFMDTFAHFPGVWCLMPKAFYEQAKQYMPTTAEYSDTFFDKIDEYMYEIQGRNSEIIYDAKANGVNVYIIGAYGYAGIPLTDGCKNRTDTLIDTYLMTGNCAVAPYGKTLDDIEYSKDGACTAHNHVSTDNIIDASVGMLPENT